MAGQLPRPGDVESRYVEADLMPRAGVADGVQQRLRAGAYTSAARAATTTRPFTPPLAIEAVRTGQRGSDVDRDRNRYRYRDRDRERDMQETGARHSHMRIDAQRGVVTRAAGHWSSPL